MHNFFYAHDFHCLFIIYKGLILYQVTVRDMGINTQSDEQLLCFQIGVQENKRERYNW